ncbi:MAG: hypothetical protein M3R54_01350 [Chloroflexota bacterium]|nr:hypothetical protein [Chloroflexota bacterium]
MSLSGKVVAALPVFMSLVIIAFGIREVMMFGPVRQQDEGVGAHLFQIFMPLEVLLIGYFGFTWLPRAPRLAAAVLVLQIGLALAIVGTVFVLGL